MSTKPSPRSGGVQIWTRRVAQAAACSSPGAMLDKGMRRNCTLTPFRAVHEVKVVILLRCNAAGRKPGAHQLTCVTKHYERYRSVFHYP